MKKCTSCGRMFSDEHPDFCESCGGTVFEMVSPPKKKEKAPLSILKAWLYTAAYTGVNYAVAFAAIIPLAIIYLDPEDPDHLTKILTTDISNLITLAGYVLFAVLLTVFFLIRKKNVLRETGIGKCSLPVLAVSALFGVSANYLYSFVIGVIPWPDSLLEAHNDAYALLDGDGNILLTVVTVALFTGILEEVVYRGLVMTRLRRSVHPAVACVISALLFSFAHPSIISAVYTFVFGACLALVFEKYSSTLPCIVAHVCFNLMACIGYPEGGTATIIILAACAILHVASIIALVKLPVAKGAKADGAESI